MELIKAEKIHYNTGSKDLLVNAGFRILEGETYALIGPNGTGKTTLIRMILGEIQPDKGQLRIQKKLNIGYVPQNQETDFSATIEDFLGEPTAHLAEKLNALETQMGSTSGDDLEKLLEEYQKVTEEFEYLGGYTALEKGENLLQRLGLDNPLSQELITLSGGERSLVFFARALMQDPDLLILDEPGNHLDYLGLAWLEAFLANCRCAVLIVSHNRYLLDKTCRHLIAMDKGKLTCFTGTYSDYRIKVLRKAVVQRGEYEACQKRMAGLQKKIKQLQSIAMAQYNPPAVIMAQLAAAKRKYAEEQAKNLEKPDLNLKPIDLNIQGEESKSRIAVRIKNYTLAFGSNTLLKDVNMEIHCGERVALVGANGSGKSSLLKKLLENGKWDHPNLKIGPSQKIGYLSQVPSFHESAVTIEDEVRSWGPLTKDDAFGLINKMGFSYEDMDKRISVLSGGETNRLQLSRFIYLKTNLLVLDEPTNHMDIPSREVIEEGIADFEGTVLVISHDRYFLDNLVDRVVEISDHQLVSYQGNFTEYFQTRYPTLPRLSGSVNSRGSERRKDTSLKSVDTGNLEQRIEQHEEEKLSMEKELERCLLDNNHIQGRKVAAELEKLVQRLNKLYDEWEQVLN